MRCGFRTATRRPTRNNVSFRGTVKWSTRPISPSVCDVIPKGLDAIQGNWEKGERGQAKRQHIPGRRRGGKRKTGKKKVSTHPKYPSCRAQTKRGSPPIVGARVLSRSPAPARQRGLFLYHIILPTVFLAFRLSSFVDPCVFSGIQRMSTWIRWSTRCFLDSEAIEKRIRSHENIPELSRRVGRVIFSSIRVSSLLE